MSNIYQLYCETEGKFVSGSGDSRPVTCYTDAGHTINESSVETILQGKAVPAAVEAKEAKTDTGCDAKLNPKDSLLSLFLQYPSSETVPSDISGIWESPQKRNIKYSRTGDTVTMRIDAVRQIASATGVVTITPAIPQQFRPPTSNDSDTTDLPCRVYDGGIMVDGCLTIDHDGRCTIRPRLSTGLASFSGSGNSGFNNIVFVWLL